MSFHNVSQIEGLPSTTARTLMTSTFHKKRRKKYAKRMMDQMV